MTPSKLQYFLARGFSRITCSTATLIAAFTAWTLCPSLSLLRDWSFVFYYISAIVLVWPLGWFGGVFFVWPFFLVLAHKLNGAPFQEGDSIHILTGPHRDRVTRVYEVWPTRNQVRVELGEEHKKAVTDVFDYTQICHERNAEQGAAGQPLGFPSASEAHPNSNLNPASDVRRHPSGASA